MFGNVACSGVCFAEWRQTAAAYVLKQLLLKWRIGYSADGLPT
jgi:hypothetical protein